MPHQLLPGGPLCLPLSELPPTNKAAWVSPADISASREASPISTPVTSANLPR